MTQGALPVDARGPAFARGGLASLDREAAATLAIAAGDIILLIDRDGVIRDMAVSSPDLAADGLESWLDRRWIETVSSDSRHKVEDLLREGRSGAPAHWREINQVNPRHNSLMVRYLALSAGPGGNVMAIGRDDRGVSALQQRLLETQQAMERDYARLRDAESRYRLLCQISGEGIIAVDSATRRIIEVNPAAERMTGQTAARMVGEPFFKLFDSSAQDDAASLLVTALTASRAVPTSAKLSLAGREVEAAASLYRRDRSTHFLIRLSMNSLAAPETTDDATHVHAVIERMPDALVITDTSLKIMTANTAFLDLLHFPNKEQVLGQSIGDYLGRAPAERNLLVGNVREHGYVRNYATVIRDRYDEFQDVEVSVVSAKEREGSWLGFHIRAVRKPPPAERSAMVPDLHRSVEQLTQLVGRVKLKDLVRETTDIVERLCIEAALELTKNNRASAAELLGLSRQSLYSKLNRFGGGKVYNDDD
jgi:transcriptional regulator PpsR